jgi:rubredoxin
MDKYICKICKYTYDPEKGDPFHGVNAGTSWEDVPDTWQCPVCSAKKSSFVKFDELKLTDLTPDTRGE